MPHDSNGTELIVGDIVTAEFEVAELIPETEMCNATVRLIQKNGGVEGALTANTKSFTLKHREAEPKPADQEAEPGD